MQIKTTVYQHAKVIDKYNAVPKIGCDQLRKLVAPVLHVEKLVLFNLFVWQIMLMIIKLGALQYSLTWSLAVLISI